MYSKRKKNESIMKEKSQLARHIFKEFKLLRYSDNERAKYMELWMIERALLGLSFKREIILSL